MLNVGDELRVVGFDLRRVATDDFAVAADEELLEVPLDRAGVGRVFREVLVERRLAVAVDLDLLEQVEINAVLGRAERGDLLGRAGFLAAELVTGNADDREAGPTFRSWFIP